MFRQAGIESPGAVLSTAMTDTKHKPHRRECLGGAREPFKVTLINISVSSGL